MLQMLGRFGGGVALVAAMVGAGAGLALVPLGAAPAGATTPTITVNDANDTTTGTNCTPGEEGDCSLRAAIKEAETLAESVTIVVPDAATVPNNPNASHIYQVLSSNGQLDVNDNGNTVTITGAGTADDILQAQCTGADCSVTTRVLKVESGTTADVSDVTIEDGDPSGGNGGGILNCGTLDLADSVVTENDAQFSGGGIEGSNGGSTTLTNDTISDNTQTGADEQGGGGIYVQGQTSTASTLSISDGTTISENNADGGPGGGIELGGTDNVNTVATIDGSTIEDNFAKADGGGGIAQESVSTLAVTNTTITENGPTETATIDGGGVYLLAAGSVDTFTDDTITDNSPGTDGDGGGVYVEGADPDFSGGTINGNSATDGAGVYTDGGVNTFDNVDISDNTASDEGGGVYLGLGTNTFTGGDVNDNIASSEGGGVYVEDGTNSFSGGTINGNGNGDGGGAWLDGGTNTFTDETVSGNQADDSDGGAGIWIEDGINTFTNDAVINNDATGSALGGGLFVDGGTNDFSGGSVSDNQAYAGGGGYIDYGTNTFTQSTISGNRVPEGGGGLWIDVEETTQPTTITQSTINDNTAQGSVGVTYLGYGGGILSTFCNAITLTNDTITGNTASEGGGGYADENCGSEPGFRISAKVHAPHAHQASDAPSPHGVAHPDVQFVFDTVSGNSSGADKGGNIQVDDTATISAAETIIAGGVSGGTVGTNCAFSEGGTLTSGGYNLVDDSTCGISAATDLIGENPQLGALANNGGPTETQLPADNAPEVGAVPDATCVATGVGTDQRGVARGAGASSSCTIGAVEVGQNFNGYRLVANEGGIFDFGLLFSGSLANNHLNAPIVGLANAPGPAGYLMVGADGGVFALGGAAFYGSLGGQAIPSPIAAIAAPLSENGYWLAAQNGKIYNFGSVPALPAVQLPPGAHIVGMASTADGTGAWLTDQFGDVYAEGSAQYEGGLGGVHINAPIVGIAAAASGQGYILVATDGGVFNYGTQAFFGSVPGSLAPGQQLVAPIVGIAVTHSGKGYWEVGADGGVFTYGDAPFLGSIYTAIDGTPLNGPIVGIQHLGSVTPPA